MRLDPTECRRSFVARAWQQASVIFLVLVMTSCSSEVELSGINIKSDGHSTLTIKIAATSSSSDLLVNTGNVSGVQLSGKCSREGATFTVAAKGSDGVSKSFAPTKCENSSWSTSLDMSQVAEGSGVITFKRLRASESSPAVAEVMFFKDTIAPTVVITGSLGSSSASPVTMIVTFSEDVTSFTTNDLIVRNITASNLTGSRKSYMFSAYPILTGSYGVSIPAGVVTDVAGNPNSQSNILSATFTSTQPTTTITSTAPVLMAASPIPVTVSFSAPVTGFVAADVSVSNGTLGGFSGSGKIYAFDVTPLGQGAVTINVADGVAVDIVGSANLAAAPLVITYDSVAPVATLSGLPEDPSLVTSLSVTVSSATNDVVNYKYKVGPDSTTDCSVAASYSASTGQATPITASISDFADGVLKLCVVAADAAGNWQSYSEATSSTWTKDTTPPTFTSIDLANDAVDGYISASERSGGLLAILTNLIASGHLTVGYAVVSIATDCNGLVTYAAGIPNSQSSGFSSDGSYKVCVKLTDAAGNISYAASNKIILDTVAPSVGGDGVISPTSITPVSLFLSWAKASDAVTAQEGLQYLVYQSTSNNLSTVANIETSGVAVGSYGVDISSKSITELSASTTYYFNLIVKDAAGNKAAYTSIAQATNPAIPVLTTISDRVFPSNQLNIGATLLADWNNVAAGGNGDDVGMNYTCSFDTAVDGAVSSGAACATLPGTASFNAATGVLSWTPTAPAIGAYELRISGTLSGETDVKYLVVDVRQGYVTNNLLGDWDANFVDFSRPASAGYLSWKDLSGNGNHGTLNNTTSASWSGSGTAASPYSLSFDGSGSVDFGSVGANSTKMMFSAWVKSSDANSANDLVIIGSSGNGAGNGFSMRQKPSYRDVVMSLNPFAYWRLGESSGVTSNDLSGGSSNGTYLGGPTLGQVGGIAADEDQSVSFDGVDDYISTGLNPSVSLGQNVTISGWVYPTADGNYRGVAGSHIDSFRGVVFLQAVGGVWTVSYGNGSAWRGVSTSLTLNTWSHVVAVYSGSAYVKVYVNGVLVASQSQTTGIAHHTTFWIGRAFNGSNRYFQGRIDELAVFNKALTASQVTSLYQAGIVGRNVDLMIGKNYPNFVMADSPSGYWRFNESLGKTAIDRTSNGQHGIYSVGVSLGQNGAVMGDSDSSVSFNGTTGSVTMGAGNYLNLLSLEAWISPANTILDNDLRAIVGRYESSPYRHNFAMNIQNQRLMFSFWNGSTWSNALGSNNSWNAGAWYHIVATYDGTTPVLYVNGVVDTLTVSTGFGAPIPNLCTNCILSVGGNVAQSSNYFSGKIDEVAVYPAVLTPAQVLTHYQAGIGTYGGVCSSISGFATGSWNFIAGLFDGNDTKFYVNGRQECNVSSVPQKISPPTTNLVAGATAATTNGWLGELANFMFYGTSDESSVGTDSDVKRNFDTTADRFRINPIGNLVTNGLVMNFDVANAKQGLRAYRNGCAAGDLKWFDLSVNAMTGTLSNFSGCGLTSGWLGTGVSTDPNRLRFDGTNDFVSVPHTNSLNMTTTWTVGTWVRFSGFYTGTCLTNSIFHKGTEAVNGSYWLTAQDTGGCSASSGVRVAGFGFMANDGSKLDVYGTSNLTTGVWHHLMATFDGSSLKIYVNGSMENTLAVTKSLASNSNPITIGKMDWAGSTYDLNGEIGNVVIYNQALTQLEISQNCKAMQSRFAGAICN